MQAFVIDAFSFAKNGERRQGSIPIADLPRLVSECANTEGDIEWSLEGGLDQFDHPKLNLRVKSHIPLVCQRCLQTFALEFDSESELILAKNEDHADEIEAMIDDDEIDVVVGSKSFNILDLIEDEVLLAIPQSPKHAVCPDVVVPQAAIDEPASRKPSPFAVLKNMK
jgi:uncharacterized protein